MSALAKSSRARMLVLLAALVPLAGPVLAQSSPAPSPLQNFLGALRQAAEPDALTASYSGAISFTAPSTSVIARVTHGKVQCTGSMSTGEGPPISYAGVGKIDLELGVGGTSESGQTLRDQYRITLHCPVNGDVQRSMADIANTAYQPGGRVTQISRTGGLQGPERLKGVWHANGESFSWDLCRANCRP